MTDKNKEKVIIIGSGPAGHTAAIYTGRALLEPLMFEGFLAGGVAAGGQLTTTTDVENYPGFPNGVMGPELMQMMRQQSLNSGARIETKTVDSIDISSRPYKVVVGNETYETDTIIISTGATAKRLDLPGVDTYWQKGISACAVCDGGLPFFRNKQLVVIGGGDTACEEALFLTKFASKVIMLVRRDKLRASKVMAERVMAHENIEIKWNTEGKAVTGDEKMMTGMTIVNNQTNEETQLEAGGLFFAIGHKPNTDFLGGQIKLDDTGYIITLPGTPTVLDPTTDESIPGVYAAGDVQDKHYRQAITSAGTGCMAAMDAEHYIQTLT